MEFEKVQKGIFDPVSENVKKLAELFPSAVKDGQIDLEALKSELGQFETVNRKLSERYELGWAGKEDAKRIAMTDVVDRTLKYVPEDSKDQDTTENLYIEGDNFEVLKLLRNSYFNNIKLIYIDPPYNTGNDFIYLDDFTVTEEKNAILEGEIDREGERAIVNQKSNGKYHANWLSMIYPRLKVAKDLLCDNGLLFVSIGSDELSNLIYICNEVFGETNKLAVIGRVMKTASNNGNFFAPSIDYILCYAKNKDLIDKLYDKVDESLYKKVESEGERKGEKYRDDVALYQSSLKDLRPNQKYFITCPDGSQVLPPCSIQDEIMREGDGRWRWTKDKYIQDKYLLVFKKTKKSPLVDANGNQAKWNIYTKSYLKDREETGTLPRDIWNDFINRKGADLLKKIDIPFDFSKPVEMVEYMISIMNFNEGIVLDFFSGSATTAHAVMKYNAENDCNIKYIMVQIPEPCEEGTIAKNKGFDNICEIGKERIRRAGEKIKEENKDKEGIENLDIGFKVFRTSDTNIRWFSEAIKSDIFDYDETMSDKDKLDFNPGYTDIDVVYEILLRHRDIPLSTNVEKLSSIGDRTYIFADAVVVCLEENVTETIIDKIAAIEPMPTKVIFRDSAFEDDISLKTNSMLRLEAQMRKNSGIEKKAYRVEFI